MMRTSTNLTFNVGCLSSLDLGAKERFPLSQPRAAGTVAVKRLPNGTACHGS